MPEPKALLWCDLETTGSDHLKDQILEVGAIVTDMDLKVQGEFESLVSLTDAGWDRLRMTDYHRTVLEMHQENGLLDALEDNSDDIDAVDDAFSDWIDFMHDAVGFKRHELLLAGSGVSHFDRRFLETHLPEAHSWLQYPNLDVGVIRRGFLYLGAPELVPSVPDSFGDKKPHRALADARGHLREAMLYKERFQRIVRLLNVYGWANGDSGK